MTTERQSAAHRLITLVENTFAAIGLLLFCAVLLAHEYRDELAAWYRTLPVVIAAWHCPAPPPQP